MASLQRLATVELQLIMHGCDTRTLLQLARCCRATIAAASSAVAWHHLPQRLNSSRLHDEDWRQWRSLLRFADVHLRLSLGRAAAAAWEPIISAFGSIPRLRRLELTWSWWNEEELLVPQRLLLHAAAAQLTALS